MNYFAPIFLDSESDYKSPLENKVYVFPYNLKCLSVQEEHLLFNFPSSVCVYINGLFIPSECFDYFNPLLVSKYPIRFYDKVNKIYIDNVECMKIASLNLNKKTFEFLLKQTIYYPYGYTIYYNNYRIVNSSLTQEVVQFCDILPKLNKSVPVQTYHPFPPFPNTSGLPQFVLPASLLSDNISSVGLPMQMQMMGQTGPQIHGNMANIGNIGEIIDTGVVTSINPLNLMNLFADTLNTNHPLYINSTQNEDEEDGEINGEAERDDGDDGDEDENINVHSHNNNNHQLNEIAEARRRDTENQAGQGEDDSFTDSETENSESEPGGSGSGASSGSNSQTSNSHSEESNSN